jgi:multicomponent Na+:H+ antiporter subunit E
VSRPLSAPGRRAPAAAVRSCAFLALWVVLIGGAAGDLLAGVPTAAAATWASLRLLPPGSVPLRAMAVPSLALRFAWKSAVAGWDIARRALDPRLPVRPGFVVYRVGFPRGPLRNVFTTLTSLMPGSVPAGDDGGVLLYHCLDVEQPVAAQLAAEEAVLTRALRGSPGDD